MTTNALQDASIHAEWRSTYRNGENENFFEVAFDRIAAAVRIGPILDAGCGSGDHAVNLAERGFHVTAIDFSQHALTKAREVTARYADKIKLQRADITKLQFADGAFANVMCWGVLMHVPDSASALRELARVTAPGGHLIISESNMHSPHVTIKNLLRRMLGRYKAKRTYYGLETRIHTAEGEFITQQADIRELIARIECLGFSLEHRWPSELTDIYVSVKSPAVRKLIHVLNRLCYLYAPPGLALGNLLVFRKH